MKIRLKMTKLEVTGGIQDYFQRKMDMLDKYLNGVQVLNCDCEVEKIGGAQKSGKVFRAEVNLEVPGSLLRVEREETDVYKAIDKVKDHLVLVIKKHRDKKGL